MIVNNRPLSVLADLMDGAEVTDDFVTGVIALGDGRFGGDEPDTDSWVTRRMERMSRRFGFGKPGIARSQAAAYGPVQLAKAANEAGDLVRALDTARTIAELGPLVARLDDLSIATLPTELRLVEPTGGQLASIHDRLSAARAAMIDARTRIVLEQARRARPE